MKYIIIITILLLNTLLSNEIFTNIEKQWIKNNQVVVGVESWEPVVYLNEKKEIDGITGDILKLIIKKTGLKVNYTTESWDKLLSEFKDKKIDILPATYYTKQRATFGLYSKEYFKMREFIYIKQNNDTIKSFEDLKGKKIAIIKDYGTIPKIKEKYPTINIIETKDMEESINFVLEGKVDAYIDAQIGVVNFLSKNVIVGIKGISQDSFKPSPLHLFINSNKEILKTILDKSLELITQQEKNKIISKWLEKTNFQNNMRSYLTNDEIKYIKNHKTILMCNNPNWTPIEFKENGTMHGIAIDYLKEIEHKLNIKFKTVETTTWSQSQEYLKNKKCDILPAATKTKTRLNYAIFTKNYMSHKLAIITRNDQPFVDSLDSILDKKMTRKKGSGLISKLKNSYPKINIIETTGYEESLKMVSIGDAYYTIATLPVASYYITKFGLYNLHIAGYLNSKFDLAIAVRNDKKILRDILDKTMSTISNKKIVELQNDWSKVNIIESKSFSTKLLIQIISTIIIIALLLLYRQYKLKQHHKELKQTNKKFELMLNNTMEGVILIKNGLIIEANNSALKLFDENKDDIIGKNPLSFVVDDFKKLVRDNLQLNFVSAYEINIKIQKNKIIPVLVQASNFISENETIRFVSILDLSDIKQKEQLLSHSSKMAQMGEMIGNIAHQWRQPLSVITTAATGIKVKKEFGLLEDEELFEFIDSIVTNSRHLSDTIDTFRDFIKEKVELQEVVVQDRIDNALKIISTRISSKHIKLINNIDYDLKLHVLIVKGELSQVIINIFNNSIDVLEDLKIADKWIRIDLEKKGNSAVITIEDNGGGIPEDILPNIFEPYFTTKHQSQGTGIGLYMSYDIITNHIKGKLYAKNSDMGAKFFIELPLHQIEL